MSETPSEKPTDPVEKDNSAGSSELDLAKTGEKALSDKLDKPLDRPYDPAEDRERVRGYIALGLVGILGAIVLLAFIYVLITLLFCVPDPHIESLKTLLEILVSPVVGLVGAVTGFYFGEKTKSQ